MTNIFKNSVKNLIKLFSATGLFLIPIISLAANNDLVYTLQVPILGITKIHSSQVMNYLIAFYKVGFYLTIAFAFGGLVYGGFVYMISGGNTSTKQHGLDFIWGAVWGLLIIFGSYALLNTINPALTNSNLSGLKEVRDTDNTTTTNNTNTNEYCATATSSCANLISSGKWKADRPAYIDILSDDYDNLNKNNCIDGQGEIDLASSTCANIVNGKVLYDLDTNTFKRINPSSSGTNPQMKIFILPKEKCGAYKGGKSQTVGLCAVKLYPPQSSSK